MASLSQRARELKRDPQDLVLTGRGSAAEERKRDPKDLLLDKKRKRARRRRRPQGGLAKMLAAAKTGNSQKQ